MQQFFQVGAAALVLSVAFSLGCARSQAPAERVNVTNVSALRTALGGGAAETTATAAAPVAEPTGWASLKGSFKLNGQGPQPTRLTVSKDENVCAPGGKAVYSEALVVDSSGGIK